MAERTYDSGPPQPTRVGRFLTIARDPLTAGLAAVDRLRTRVDEERILMAESDGREGEIDLTDLTDSSLWSPDPGLERYADTLPAKTPVAQAPQAHLSSQMPGNRDAERTWIQFENGDPPEVTNLLPEMDADAGPVIIHGAQTARDILAQGDTTDIDDHWDPMEPPVLVTPPKTQVMPHRLQPDDTADLGIPNTGLLKVWRDHRTRTKERREADNRNVGWDVPVRDRKRREPQVHTMKPVRNDDDAREARVAALRARREPTNEPVLVPVTQAAPPEAAQTEQLPVVTTDHLPDIQKTESVVESNVIPFKKPEKLAQKPEKNRSVKFDPKRGEAPVLYGMTMHDAQVILNREVGMGPEQQQVRREMHAFVTRAGELSERRALTWFNESTARNMYLSMLDHVSNPAEHSFQTKAQLEAYEKIKKHLASYFQKSGKRSWDEVMPASQIEDMAAFLHGYFGGYYDQQLGGLTKRGARNEFFKAATNAYKSAQQLELMAAA